MAIIGKAMLRAGLAALAMGAMPSAAKAAIVYDAYASFNGTQGADNFTYAMIVGGTPSYLDTNAGCTIAGTTCLKSSVADLFGGPQAAKSLTAFQSSSIAVPNDRLILVPGLQAVAIRFTTPTAGIYSFSSNFNIIDNAPTGVTVNYLSFFNGVLSSGTIGNLIAAGQGAGLGFGAGSLNAGDFLEIRIDNGGTIGGHDSIGAQFTVTQSTPAVPEPATWATTLAGFGLIGGALRRRRGKQAVRVAYS